MIEAIQEPTKPVGYRFQILLGLANASATMALLPVLTIIIPAQVTAYDANHAATNLAVVLTCGALGALVGNPFSGALSDRTTSRFGRRSPWIFIGMLTTALALILLANSRGIEMIALGWFGVQFFGNFLMSSYSAILPDRVPVRQRGTTQAIIGFASPIAMLATAYYLGKLSDLKTGYYTIATAVIVLSVIFLAFYREPQLPRGALPPFQLRSFLASFWINPLTHPDFGLAWIFWFMVWGGYTLGTGGYLYLYLQNIIHYSTIFPGHMTKEAIATIQVLQIAVGVPLMALAGSLSDRLRVRKPFVAIGTALVTLGLLLLAIFPRWGAIEAAGTIIGAGFWIYYSMGVAMISQLLPSASSRGKDLGVINIASALPQIMMPWAGAGIIAIFGDQSPLSFLVIFSVSALCAACGIYLLQRIKTVA